MRPNISGIDRIMNRIEEITRKYGAPFEPRGSVEDSAPGRFVELLNAESAKGEKAEKAKKSREGAEASLERLRGHISRLSEKYNVDEELIRAVIQVESGWNSDAVSSKGARGLMQLMPNTAAMLGVEDSFDPEQNTEGGVKYLAQLTDKYQGDVELALAAYNAGPSRVDSAGEKIPFPETERYVKNVMKLYHRYREEE